MALILNIDTAVESASVCVSGNGTALAFAKNQDQKDHAGWLHAAINDIFEKMKVDLRTIDAVAVTEGPGSYTGLRIGMATAKGICYALNKPLITLNTLLVMANAAKAADGDLLCPMIDARRMDVYAALYTKELNMLKEPAAITLDKKSFDEELKKNKISFFGNGSKKFQSLKNDPAAIFSDIDFDASSMIALAGKKFSEKDFADLAYAEPLYLKEFYTPAK